MVQQIASTEFARLTKTPDHLYLSSRTVSVAMASSEGSRSAVEVDELLAAWLNIVWSLTFSASSLFEAPSEAMIHCRTRGIAKVVAAPFVIAICSRSKHYYDPHFEAGVSVKSHPEEPRK